MATAGVDLRQTAAAIGVLGDMGIQGSMAGTSLANMIRYLQLSLVNQKKKGYNALADLGLSPDEFFDAQGNLIDLYTIYQKFAKAAVDLPSRIETPTFFNIFGVRGNRGMLPVLRDIASGRDKMGKILATYDQNIGAVNRLNEERLKTDAGVIDQFESSIENLTVTAGAALGRIFTPVLNVGNSIIKVINSISETWVGSFGLRVAATGVVVGTIVAGFNTVRGIIRSVGYLQTIATASTEGMSTATAKTNAQFVIMEAHLRNISFMMSSIAAQTLGMGKSIPLSGGFFMGKDKRGRAYYRDSMGRRVSQGTALGGTNLISTTVREGGKQAGKKLATSAALGLGGRLMGLLGGPVGLAITIGLPLLIEVGSSLIKSVDRNTEAQSKEDPSAIRAQNEERFLNAMRAAIRDGLKDGKINISVDGEILGDYSLGSQQDYTGVALGL